MSGEVDFVHCPLSGVQSSESFFKTLKREEVYLKQYQTFQEAEDNIREFIEDVYNTKRLHSSLGYLPPSEFEEAFNRKTKISLLSFLVVNAHPTPIFLLFFTFIGVQSEPTLLP